MKGLRPARQIKGLEDPAYKPYLPLLPLDMTLFLYAVARLRLAALAVLAFTYSAYAREESLCVLGSTTSVYNNSPSPHS